MLTAAKQILLSGTSTGIRDITLANVITDATRRAAVEGDGLSVPGGLGVWPAVTNILNTAGHETSFEGGTTGWGTGGTNTIAQSTDQAYFGTNSLKCTYQNDVNLAFAGLTLTAAAHMWHARVYVPTAYDGTALKLRAIGYTSATGTTSADVNMSLRDQWQHIVMGPFTPDAGDLAGSVYLREDGVAGTAGRFVYLDAAIVHLGSLVLPFDLTTRAVARVQVGTQGLFTATQGWVMLCIRPGLDWAGSGSSLPTGDNAHWFEWGTPATDSIGILLDMTTNAALRMRRGNGTLTSSTVLTTALTSGTPAVLIGAWDAAQVLAASNGSAFNVGAQTDIPNLAAFTAADIGSRGATGTRTIHSSVLWALTGKGTLTAADSTLGNAWKTAGAVPTLSQIAQLSAASKPTLLIPADTAASRLLPAYFGGTL